MNDYSFISLWALNFDGLIGGAAAFAIIWGTRLGCIKGEYYFRRSFRYVFLILGILGVLSGLFIDQLLLSAIFSIFGFACLWGIHEVIEQETRVNKGWYPRRSDQN